MTKEWVLLYDNALSHWSLLMQEQLSEHGAVVPPQPLCFPNFVPCTQVTHGNFLECYG